MPAEKKKAESDMKAITRRKQLRDIATMNQRTGH